MSASGQAFLRLPTGFAPILNLAVARCALDPGLQFFERQDLVIRQRSS